jgi:hypothetical protein
MLVAAGGYGLADTDNWWWYIPAIAIGTTVLYLWERRHRR